MYTLEMMVTLEDGRELSATVDFSFHGKAIPASRIIPAEGPEIVIHKIEGFDADDKSTELEYDALTVDSQSKLDEKIWATYEDTRPDSRWRD